MVLSDIVCPCETFCDYWSVQAAEQGYVEAYFRAARCFEEICEYTTNGLPLYGFGERSREYIKKGAEAGNADCQLAFGDLILNNGRLVLIREVEKNVQKRNLKKQKNGGVNQQNRETRKLRKGYKHYFRCDDNIYADL